MRRLLPGLLLVLAGTAFMSSTGAAGGDGQQPAPTGGVATEAEARVICGTACHGFPEPVILPRYAWRDEIARMALIRDNRPEPRGPRGTAGRMMVLPPDMERVLRYYLAQAPESLPVPPTWPAASAHGFVKRGLNPPNSPPDPAIANVRLFDLDGDSRLELMATDMRYGMVLRGRPYDATSQLEVVAQLNNPAHVALTDFDKDGVKDFFIGDLGEFLPADHQRGAVVWLRGTREGKFETLELDGWPRVADVELADFNGDGTLDPAVAAFGWRKVGNLTVLENHTTDYTKPSFVARVVDARPGAIHAIPVDINKDGLMDIVAVFAQQFEQVVAFINTGARETAFTPQVIYTAPHPNWGSSGIEVVDLDKDGDLDVLLTHGDTFDDQIVKPYHGIQWLENTGTYPFVDHKLADLPGVSRAQAGDLDGDGDLDIVAGAFMAGGSDVDESKLAALVWLEQVKPGVFERRTLVMGNPRYATLDLGDLDADGDLDIVVGNFMVQPRPKAWVEVWENQRVNHKGSKAQ
jgi:hypothetical protein